MEKRRCLSDCRGSIILEALLAMLLIVSCLYSLAMCFLFFAENYVFLLHKRELRAQMRLALFCMTQDLEKANKIKFTKRDGADALFLSINCKKGTVYNTIDYQHDRISVKNARILRRNQALTGGVFRCPTDIRFECRPLLNSSTSKICLLRLTGQTPAVKQPLVFETAVYCRALASVGDGDG